MLAKLKTKTGILGPEAVLAMMPKPAELTAAEARLRELRERREALRDELKARAHAFGHELDRDEERRVREITRELDANADEIVLARRARNAVKAPYARSVAEALKPATDAAATAVVDAIADLRDGLAKLQALADVNAALGGNPLDGGHTDGAVYSLPSANLRDLAWVENFCRKLRGEAVIS